MGPYIQDLCNVTIRRIVNVTIRMKRKNTRSKQIVIGLKMLVAVAPATSSTSRRTRKCTFSEFSPMLLLSHFERSGFPDIEPPVGVAHDSI